MHGEWWYELIQLIHNSLRQSWYEKIVSVWLEAVVMIEGIVEAVDASISSLENIGLLEQKFSKENSILTCFQLSQGNFVSS